MPAKPTYLCNLAIFHGYLGLLEGKHSKPGIDADCVVQNGFPMLSQCKSAILGLYAFLDKLKPYSIE